MISSKVRMVGLDLNSLGILFLVIMAVAPYVLPKDQMLSA